MKYGYASFFRLGNLVSDLTFVMVSKVRGFKLMLRPIKHPLQLIWVAFTIIEINIFGDPSLKTPDIKDLETFVLIWSQVISAGHKNKI